MGKPADRDASASVTSRAPPLKVHGQPPRGLDSARVRVPGLVSRVELDPRGAADKEPVRG
jgi:hypothetical protein